MAEENEYEQRLNTFITIGLGMWGT